MRSQIDFGTSLRHVLIALWVGSLWTVGYLVAPTLFLSLSDRVLAGTIAGKVFRVEAWLCVAMAALVAGLLWQTIVDVSMKKSSLFIVGAMLACTVLGYFCLQPLMAALRAAAPAGVLADNARMQFGIVHGVASALYLAESVLGLCLLYADSARMR